MLAVALEVATRNMLSSIIFLGKRTYENVWKSLVERQVSKGPLVCPTNRLSVCLSQLAGEVQLKS